MSIVSKQGIRDTRLPGEDQAALSSVGEILEDVRKGRPVIIVDDEDRENEGDLVIAAEMASAENINIMARDGRGLICLPMESAMVERLGLPLMGRGDNARHRTAFTVSIEAKEGVTTGISAADRAHTILTAVDPKTEPHDIATPGHVFPLKAKDGGVLVRAGHTEAAVDLAKLAGFSGAGVICEVMNDDGSMARLPDLLVFAQKHGFKIGTIADLIAYRRCRECLVERTHTESFSSRYGGDFTLHLYVNKLQYAEHIVLVKGEIERSDSPVFVRMHTVDILGDMLGKGNESLLHAAMEMIAGEGRGVIVILRDPDPHSLSRQVTKDSGRSGPKKAKAPPGTNLRDYGIGAQILLDLGVKDMILLSDNPKNVVGLDGYGLSIAGHKPLTS